MGEQDTEAFPLDETVQRRKFSEEIRKKIIEQHVKGKDYKTIFKQRYVPVTPFQILRSLMSMKA